MIGTASRHARVDGCYIDEILIEKFLPPADAVAIGRGEERR